MNANINELMKTHMSQANYTDPGNQGKKTNPQPRIVSM
jgi:hypothetical protein